MFVYTGIHCLQKNHWPALAGGDHWQWLATVKPAGHHASLAAVWSGGACKSRYIRYIKI